MHSFFHVNDEICTHTYVIEFVWLYLKSVCKKCLVTNETFLDISLLLTRELLQNNLLKGLSAAGSEDTCNEIQWLPNGCPLLWDKLV